jgi:hypothetical protein
MYSKIKKEISELSPTHLGYFGEELFLYYAKEVLKKEVLKVHREGKDFEIDGVRIDVGTRRPFTTKKIGKKISKKDAFVLFYTDCCLIDFPKHFSGEVQWEVISTLLADFKSRRRIKVKTVLEKSFNSEYEKLKFKIKNFFIEKGFKTNIIYRTVSGQFGLKESPGNLLIKKFNDDGIKIYIDFKDHQRTAENIKFIIAFPQSMENEMPYQKSVSLKSSVPKIDLIELIQIKHRSYFTSLEDLTNNFFLKYNHLKLN